MNWKLIGVILGIVLFLGVIGAAVYKIVQKTEGYKTMGNSYYYTFEPHQTFGCARYIAPENK